MALVDDSHIRHERIAADYVLPIKWSTSGKLGELATYVSWLSSRVRVIIVDGSAPTAFDAHHVALAPYAIHVAPDARHAALNGKVAGVHTGMDLALAERVIIADDDVRYSDSTLRAVLAPLGDHDLVIPQNVFAPMPWHAKWDTARTLINRALCGDYPGTMSIRRDAFHRMGGYDGDVLFENLELIRTVRASGGRIRMSPAIFVQRLPPSPDHFWSQRVRQAYDSSAQPARLAVELALLPLALAAAIRGTHWRWMPVVVPMALCAVGRRGAASQFPVTTIAFGPLWTAERAVCSWIAVGVRLRHGGVDYAGNRIGTAAHSVRRLRRRQPAQPVVQVPPLSAKSPD